MAVGVMFACGHRIAVPLEDVIEEMVCPWCAARGYQVGFHPDLDLSRARAIAKAERERREAYENAG